MPPHLALVRPALNSSARVLSLGCRLRNIDSAERHLCAAARFQYPIKRTTALLPVHTVTLEENNTVLSVEFSPRQCSGFHAIWLRDHCRCPACLHPVTGQRLVSTDDIPLDISIHTVSITPNGDIAVRWQSASGDAHISTYNPSWLQQHSYWHRPSAVMPTAEFSAEMERKALADEYQDVATDSRTQVRWTAQRFGYRGDSQERRGFPTVPAAQWLTSNAAVHDGLSLLRDYGFVIVNGVEPTVAATEAVTRRIAHPRETLYGYGKEAMWTTHVSPDQNSISDTAYTAIPLPLHTDGNYWHDTPGIQVFHAIQADVSGGGDSSLMDGFAIAHAMRTSNDVKHREAFAFLSQFMIPYHHADPQHIMKAHKPVFVVDPTTHEVTAFHFNNDDRDVVTPMQRLPGNQPVGRSTGTAHGDAPVGYRQLDHLEPEFGSFAGSLHRPDAIPRLYASLKILQSYLRDPAYQVWLGLRPGSVLVFDNTRVLHGRAGFEVKSGRTLAGCYISKEDWWSRLRVLHRHLNGDRPATFR